MCDLCVRRGDEVEHLLLRIDPHTKKVQLSLRAAELIETLEEMARKPADAAATPNEAQSANFLPEYGRFMIEATPARPYGGFTADLRMVEHNMRARRRLIEKILQPQERLITLTVFPMLGVGDFAYCSQGPVDPVQGRVADSDYISDTIIGAHPRFATLTRNIRTRRGARVDIRVPLFQDESTARDMPKENERERAAIEALLAARDPTLPPHAPRPDLDHSKEIHMDAMAFGMGNCSCTVIHTLRLLVMFRDTHVVAFVSLFRLFASDFPDAQHWGGASFVRSPRCVLADHARAHCRFALLPWPRGGYRCAMDRHQPECG